MSKTNTTETTMSKANKKNTTAAVKMSKTTVETRYDIRLGEVRGLLAHIAKAVDAHEARQANDPTNWGGVGDISHVAEELAGIWGFLGGKG